MNDTATAYATYITPDCQFCSLNKHFTLPQEQIDQLTAGVPVQDIFPAWPAPDRKQIRTGIHPSCWEEEFGIAPE